jgi:hypothetical protein
MHGVRPHSSRNVLEVIISERVSAAMRQSGIANRVITNDYPLGIITIENVLQAASLSFRPASAVSGTLRFGSCSVDDPFQYFELALRRRRLCAAIALRVPLI